MEKYYLLTFQNTIAAMSAEETLKKNQVSLVIMPTPTYITKSCGISIRILEKDFDKIKDLNKNKEINIKAIFLKQGKEYTLIDNINN